MKEKWANVVGFEGLYRVSSFGKIRTVKHVVVRKNGSPHTVERQILRPWPIGKYGHLFVGLYPSAGGKDAMVTKAVHRLVLEAFVGPCPEEMECCHNDGNPSNNKLDNLRWDTRKGNMADRSKHGRLTGSNNHRAKLKEADIPTIRAKKTTVRGVMSAVAREFGVPASAIRDIWIGRTWKHVT